MHQPFFRYALLPHPPASNLHSRKSAGKKSLGSGTLGLRGGVVGLRALGPACQVARTPPLLPAPELLAAPGTRARATSSSRHQWARATSSSRSQWLLVLLLLQLLGKLAVFVLPVFLPGSGPLLQPRWWWWPWPWWWWFLLLVLLGLLSLVVFLRRTLSVSSHCWRKPSWGPKGPARA